MKKWIFSLALVFTVSLNHSQSQEMIIDHKHDHAPGVFTPVDAQYLDPATIETGHLAVKGMQVTGYNQEARAKLDKAFALLERVVNTEEFKARVINFRNTKGERAFASNNGLSNEQIYDIFMEGRETLQQDTPGEMNFYLNMYNRPWSKVIGYTTGDTNVINTNWKYYKNFTVDSVVSNLAHEWTHKIGFDHKSAAEHDSAPYAIGYIVGDMARQILKKEELH